MSLRIALITTAAMASLACFAGQDPRLDYAFAAPNLDGAPAQVENYVSASASSGTQLVPVHRDSKRVSVAFKSATVADVLSWLQKQGVSFIVDDESLSNKHVTLNIVGQPLDNVVEALASSLGGHWEDRSGIKVFRKGESYFGTLRALPGMSTVPPTFFFRNGAKGMVPPTMNGNSVELFRSDVFDKEFAEKLSNEIQEQLKNSKIDDPEFWQKFEKELEEKLSKSQNGTMGLRRFSLTSPNQAKIFDKTRSMGTKPFEFSSNHAKQLLKSLTPEQKALNEKQGYLKLSDLTPEQRDLLGITGEGDVALSYTVDGQTLKIRSK